MSQPRMRIGLSLANAGRTVTWRAVEEGLTTLGSNPECDVCIPDAEVAPIQALLRRDGDVLTLVNRAPQGTRVSDEHVERELRLGDGDAIHVGPVVATVRFERTAADDDARNRTRTLTRTGAGASSATLAAPEALPGRVFPIDERGLSIGSDPGNDVVVTDPYVSAFHARVTLADGRVI